MNEYNIGFLGFGNIGMGIYKILEDNKDEIFHKENIKFNIQKILVNDLKKERNTNLSKDVFTNDFEDILKDEKIEVVIEVMGGIEPARTYILKALENKKTVVTANKEVLARHWHEFEKVAKNNNSGLYYEASVAGGIPIIKVLSESLQGNKISEVKGIINGTTNYVLTKMSDEGRSFSDVLEKAQKLGLAEPDPSSDISGLDVMYKLSILSSIAFHTKVPINKVFREGISGIDVQDIMYSKELGFEIKMLAIAKKYGSEIEVRVHPTLIPVKHPLSSVKDSFNAIFINGNAVGELMLYGRGAGDLPTGSAIVSDLITACQNDKKHKYQTFYNGVKPSKEIVFIDDWETEFFVRLTVKDKPGVLSKISAVFGCYDVSIASVIQKDRTQDTAPLIFVTHLAKEKSIEKAIRDIKVLDEVIKVENVIRVER